jgi:hypothetical protein
MQKRVFFLTAIAFAAFCVPASGHHSLAMYDTATKVTVEAVVTEFEWRNPHSWLHIMVKDENGREYQWTLESNSTGQLTQSGWSPDSAKPGDIVTVILNPLRDSTRGGRLEEIRHADGRTFSRQGGGAYDPRTGELYTR